MSLIDKSMCNLKRIKRADMNATSKQKGAGLIEVLISLLVIATGILGLTGLQASGLASNRTAYYRTQATILAYDIIDRQRANKAEAIAGSYLTATGPVTTTNCTSSCTPRNIARTDLTQWKASLATQLPAGDGSVVAVTGAENTYQVTVQWAREDQTSETIDNNKTTKIVIGMKL